MEEGQSFGESRLPNQTLPAPEQTILLEIGLGGWCWPRAHPPSPGALGEGCLVFAELFCGDLILLFSINIFGYLDIITCDHELIILMINRLAVTSKRVLPLRALFSQVTETKNQGKRVAVREDLQFSKKRLTDFGELPYGEIPTALQYSRPSTFTKLSNGVRVATETLAGSQTAITVAVRVGSRNESIENSSVNQFVARLATRGSTSKSRTDVEQSLNRLGAQVEIRTTREITYFTLYVPKTQVEEALALLADGIINPAFEADQIEAVKPEIHSGASTMDPERNAQEGAHYTAFRDHALGQPVNGIRDNVYSITAQQIKDFHNRYYVGQNIVVTAAGEINPEQFNELVQKNFGDLRAEVQGSIENAEKPFFTGSLMFQRDDEIANTTTSASFLAPSVTHPDSFAMNYFKRLIGDFRVDKHTGGNLNTPHLQYNSFHTDLGNYPDIVLQKPFYFAYSDVGILGNFMFGNEVWNQQLLLLSQNKMSTYAQYINQAELFRARNSYWVELLERNCPVETSQRIATQATYLNRLVSRTEVASRISHMDTNYLQNIASKWFWDVDTAVYAWGPLHNAMAQAHYTRQYKRATLGEYSIIRVKTVY